MKFEKMNKPGAPLAIVVKESIRMMGNLLECAPAAKALTKGEYDRRIASDAVPVIYEFESGMLLYYVGSLQAFVVTTNGKNTVRPGNNHELALDAAQSELRMMELCLRARNESNRMHRRLHQNQPPKLHFNWL